MLASKLTVSWDNAGVQCTFTVEHIEGSSRGTWHSDPVTITNMLLVLGDIYYRSLVACCKNVRMSFSVVVSTSFVWILRFKSDFIGYSYCQFILCPRLLTITAKCEYRQNEIKVENKTQHFKSLECLPGNMSSQGQSAKHSESGSHPLPGTYR